MIMMKDKLSMKKGFLLVSVFVIYIAFVLYITIFSREPDKRVAILAPFWELRKLLSTKRKVHWFLQIFLNVMLFVPLGVLCPALCRLFRSFVVMTLTALLCSVVIETVQYLTARGLAEFDDVMHNTIGSMIGFITFNILRNKLCDKSIIS